LWALTHNAWVIVQTVSSEKLGACLADPAFREQLQHLLRHYENHSTRPHWFQTAYPNSAITSIVYFSMEFMLSGALPIYSGGLGNVAGDQLKAASDLGVPVYGVGLLYQQGYFRQRIDADGHQEALYPYNDPTQLPISPLRESNGEWLRLSIHLPGVRLWLRTWEVRVGRARLFLLDSNDPANLPDYRGFTSELYGGGPETRLQQERILGIGGWRLLRAIGLRPNVCHLNEGHAAFAILERAREFMEDTKQSFDVALAATRAGNLFTTHTPVEAGFDRFQPALMEQHFRRYAEERLGISFAQLMALGRLNPGDVFEPFNMAYLALRGSGAVNGVSQLHEGVSRRLFQPLFPRWSPAEVPVGHVTNGVHVPTWDSEGADRVWTAAAGKDRWRGDLEDVAQALDSVPASELWKMRTESRSRLVDYVRTYLARQLGGHGASSAGIELAGRLFDPDTLTIGFARRFAAYKRPNLLLRDQDRLLRILTNHEQPVQLVVAGKAHPQDVDGQEMIRQWISFIRGPARLNAVFLADYDMQMTEQLVRGVDVWLNTPRRPWEASGTSGMKVLVNGGLNLSELDGWWAEASSPDVGWSIGDGAEHGSDPAWDLREAEHVYSLLEHEIVPLFYERDQMGIPRGWLDRVRRSMSRLTPQFSANRVVREYVDTHYVSRAKAFCERARNKGAGAVELARWREAVEEHWPRVRFGSLEVASSADQHVFTTQVYLDDLDADAVRIELFADSTLGREPEIVEMKRGEPLVGASNAYQYAASVLATRPVREFTPRIVPFHPLASVPLECARILWWNREPSG
jgi:starch phosphorylase